MMNRHNVYFRLFAVVLESALYTGILALFFSIAVAAIISEPWAILATVIFTLPLLGYQSVVLLFSSRGMHHHLVYSHPVDLFDKLLPMVLMLVTVPIALVLLAIITIPDDLLIWLLLLCLGLCIAYVHTWLFASSFMTRFSENNPEF